MLNVGEKVAVHCLCTEIYLITFLLVFAVKSFALRSIYMATGHQGIMKMFILHACGQIVHMHASSIYMTLWLQELSEETEYQREANTCN